MSSEITRELLQTSPVEGLPGWETRLFLITYPAGANGSGHSHPVPGIGYVLEGTMVSAFDSSPTEPMRFVIAYTVKVGEPNTTWPPM